MGTSAQVKMGESMRTHLVRAVFAIGMLGAAVALPSRASAAPPAGTGEIQSTLGFRNALTVEGVREHQAAFQAHSNANGGNRVASSVGFEASASYVKSRARAAGYVVSDHFFEFLYNADATPPTLRQDAPNATTYVDGVDYGSMTFSGSIPSSTANVWAVDLVLPQAPGPGFTTSGCEASDFAGMPAGSIALIQRGTCTFGLKTDNAIAAGALAVIIFNDGGDAGRVPVIFGTLGEGVHGPAVGTSLAVGQDLANGVLTGNTGRTVTIRIDRIAEVRTTRNVIAETPGGDPDHVVVVGAHLDSVPRGPGINDNGSGSAAILEIAEVLAARGIQPVNKVRFIWFSAEEFGLLGSQDYVDGLSAAEIDRIEAMLNFDMIGSPNFVRFIYDGNNSAFPVGPGVTPGPPGSAELERIFTDYFASQGLAAAETPFNGRSDYGPFIDDGIGIPAGGLFTGAEGIKTTAEAATYGGTVGQQYDPCYHLFCDTFANNSNVALGQMSDAAGHAVLTLARRNFEVRPLAGP